MEEHNKELLTRKYEINLKIEEIDYFLDACKSDKERYYKEWLTKVINETHVKIENELKAKCSDSELMIEQYDYQIDSMYSKGILNERKVKMLNKLVDDLKILTIENLNYMEMIN